VVSDTKALSPIARNGDGEVVGMVIRVLTL